MPRNRGSCRDGAAQLSWVRCVALPALQLLLYLGVPKYIKRRMAMSILESLSGLRAGIQRTSPPFPSFKCIFLFFCLDSAGPILRLQVRG